MSINLREETAKIVISKHYGYDTTKLTEVNTIIGKLPEKIQEAVLKRVKAMIELKALEPQLEWWKGVIGELREINKMIEESSRSISPNGAGDEYYFSISYELAGFQLKNIKKICEYVVRTWDGSKSLPPLSFWLKCVTAVKSMAPQKRHYEKDTRPQISKEEQAEVKQMMRELCESFGANTKKEGSFHNKTTLIRCYGILQNLNKGLRQVQTLDGKDYEWVDEWEIGDREVVDHSKVLELFNSGRVSEKEAKKAWEEQ
jgi:hypothetical protein